MGYPTPPHAWLGLRRHRRTTDDYADNLGEIADGCWQEYEQAYRAAVADQAVPGLRGCWLAQDVQDPDGGFAVSLWDSLEAMQAYEQSAVFRQEMQPTLQPFCVGEYTTSRCDVKYEQ